MPANVELYIVEHVQHVRCPAMLGNADRSKGE